jgi:alanine racemase
MKLPGSATTTQAIPAVDQGTALRSTHAVIDLDAIAGNVRIVRESLTPGTALMAVVKGNGYGHGAVCVAQTALEAGAGLLAVATIGEAQLLRCHGIEATILVLGPINPSEYASALDVDLDVTLIDAESIAEMNRAASECGRVASVHLKVDTGMNRFGCGLDEAPGLALQIDAASNLRLGGVFTHFAEADGKSVEMTRQQAARFDQALAAISDAGVRVPMRHAANSAATLRSREFDYDAVRLGVAMYGLAPSGEVPLLPGMRPAMRLRSRIARIHDLEPGERVSYGGTYVAETRERIALIPCGYADGYSRAHSNRGWLASGSETLPIRGRVCMDQLMVGLSDLSELRVGSEVTLLGDESDLAPTADSIAAALRTINYEVVTSIAARVPRVYVRGGEVVAIQDLSGLSLANPHP